MTLGLPGKGIRRIRIGRRLWFGAAGLLGRGPPGGVTVPIATLPLPVLFRATGPRGRRTLLLAAVAGTLPTLRAP